jgi:hypothetical protein
MTEKEIKYYEALWKDYEDSIKAGVVYTEVVIPEPKMLFGGTVDYFGKQIDDSEYKWIINNEKVYNSYKNKTPLRLSQIIKHKKLFDKYSDIKNIIVKFGCITEDKVADSHTEHYKEGYSHCVININLNFKYYEKHGKQEFTLESGNPEFSKESVLLHEIQHVCQQAGGRYFGRGYEEIYMEYLPYITNDGRNGEEAENAIIKEAIKWRYKSQPSEQEAMITVSIWLNYHRSP